MLVGHFVVLLFYQENEFCFALEYELLVGFVICLFSQVALARNVAVTWV